MIPQTITNFKQIPTPEGVEQKQIVMIWDELPGAAYYTQWRNGEEWYPHAGASFLYEGEYVMQWFDSDIDFATPYSYEIIAFDSNNQPIGRSLPVAMIAFGGSPTTPFATVAELSAYWRPITAGAETERATMLLNIASSRLRITAGASVNLDEKSTNDPLFAQTLKWIVMEAVKRAMISPVDAPSVETYQQTAGPYSENYKYTNPTGDLFFRKSELAAIGLSVNQRLSSISPKSSREVYPTDEG